MAPPSPRPFPTPAHPFQSFSIGGFECSTHRRPSRRRLDVIAATAHDVNAAADYAQLAAHGMRAARDGFRWHLSNGGRAATTSRASGRWCGRRGRRARR